MRRCRRCRRLYAAIPTAVVAAQANSPIATNPTNCAAFVVARTLTIAAQTATHLTGYAPAGDPSAATGFSVSALDGGSTIESEINSNALVDANITVVGDDVRGAAVVLLRDGGDISGALARVGGENDNAPVSCAMLRIQVLVAVRVGTKIALRIEAPDTAPIAIGANSAFLSLRQC